MAQYSNNDVMENLHTSGGEYICSDGYFPGCGDGDNATYVGPMHYHPSKGYMAGAKHSSEKHPLLVSARGGIYRKGGKIKNKNYKGYVSNARKLSAGGKLVGPSHEQGGIQAIVDGIEPIEVEGGEFIINKQTVDAVGEEFLHKLNSTETTHHTGGFNENELPTPSNFKDGGKVNRRNNMARGRKRAPMRGRAPARRRGGMSTGKRRMAAGGRACGGMGQPPCNGGGYRRGGRTRPVVNRSKRMARGGSIRSLQAGGYTNAPNKACALYNSDATSCKQHGCHFNHSTGMCQ